MTASNGKRKDVTVAAKPPAKKTRSIATGQSPMDIDSNKDDNNEPQQKKARTAGAKA